RLQCVPESEVPLKAAWVQFWGERADYEQVVLAIDPAVSTDPRADQTALVTLGRTPDNLIHCLEALGRRVATPELLELIDEADRRQRPEVILFESNAAFAGLRDLLVRHTRFGPRVKGVTQGRDKATRARAFSVPVENGTFRLRGAGPGLVHSSQQALFD